MGEKTNPRLKKLLIDVVEKQLRENNPPITRITFDRLLATGNTAAMAKEKIAVAVVGQIYDAMRDGKAFDLEKYTEELNLLTDEAKTVPLGKHNLAVPFSFAG